MALSLEQRITKAHIAIFNNPNFAFLACIVMMGESVVSDEVETAGTDGRNKYYNRKYCDPLSEAELRFLILHENYHAAARHLFLYQDLNSIDSHRANIATDHWINLSLLEADNESNFIKMPGEGYADPKYSGWPIKKIFNDLKSSNQPQTSPAVGTGDTHMWDKAKELSAQEAKDLEAQIDQALRQGSILAGKLAGKTPRGIDDLLEPKVDWKEQLPDFIKDALIGHEDADWSKLDRKLFGLGHYYPALLNQRTGKLLLAPDTSGSIDSKMLTSFASEMVAIIKEVRPEGMDIVWWDSEVAGVQKFKEDEFEGIDQKLKPEGGGGTDPNCVKNWLEKQTDKDYSAIIFLSDGYVSSWPEFDIPTLWALTTKNITSAHGKTIYITED